MKGSNYEKFLNVLQKVSDKTGIEVKYIQTITSKPKVRLARQECMFILRNEHKLTLNDIAELFNITDNKVNYELSLYVKNGKKEVIKPKPKPQNIVRQPKTKDEYLKKLLIRKRKELEKDKTYTSIKRQIEDINNIIKTLD